MGLVYSYIRFSDAKQAAGASLERQREYARRWAADNGLTLDESLSMRDEGLSAYHQRHITQGALGAFMAAIEDGRVRPGSVLVVEGLDRLSRAAPIQAQGQLAQIINAGITVVTASDGKVYSSESLLKNPMDLIHSLLVMIRAHEESATKSLRVRDAIRRQCEGWVAGTYRGLIQYGQKPGWLRTEGGKWMLIEERADAIRAMVDMFLRGFGVGAIARKLHESGLSTSSAVPTSGHLQRLLTHPALVGEKHITVDGTDYVLADYYPAVIERAMFDQLGAMAKSRGRQKVKGSIPSIITGMGIAICGYCGGPMKAQTMATRRQADGSILDCNRRISCVRINSGQKCLPGSTSVAPIERALMGYCSDMLNLQALYPADRALGPRAEMNAAKAKLDTVERQLERLMQALLEGTGAPTSFTAKARELEAQKLTLQDQIKRAEADLAEAMRSDISRTGDRWRALAEGVHALDYETRMQARLLISDTFEKLVIYWKGMRPNETAKGHMHLLLAAKGGRRRLLHIAPNGQWEPCEEIGGMPAAA